MPAQETHEAVVTPKPLWDIKHTLQRMVVGCGIPVMLHGMSAHLWCPTLLQRMLYLRTTLCGSDLSPPLSCDSASSCTPGTPLHGRRPPHLSLCSAPSGLPGTMPVMCASCDTCKPRASARRSVGSCQLLICWSLQEP